MFCGLFIFGCLFSDNQGDSNYLVNIVYSEKENLV